MPTHNIHRPFATPWRALAIGAALLGMAATPSLGVAQTTAEPAVYAVSDLNLRKGPAAVMPFSASSR